MSTLFLPKKIKKNINKPTNKQKDINKPTLHVLPLTESCRPHLCWNQFFLHRLKSKSILFFLLLVLFIFLSFLSSSHVTTLKIFALFTNFKQYCFHSLSFAHLLPALDRACRCSSWKFVHLILESMKISYWAELYEMKICWGFSSHPF